VPLAAVGALDGEDRAARDVGDRDRRAGAGRRVPVDASGRAVFRLPVLEETTRVRTFAVTVEPATGSAASTGPTVLAGAAS
jgi:hypothetical protein